MPQKPMTHEDVEAAASILAMKLADVAGDEVQRLIDSGVDPVTAEEVLINAVIKTLAGFAASGGDGEEGIIKSLRGRLRDSKRIVALKRRPPN
jgi:uncharacterized spore protein YtfJ